MTNESSYDKKENYITRNSQPSDWKGHANYHILASEKDILLDGICADLGCNHGACTLLMHDFLPLRVDGYDLNNNALEIARKNAEDMNLSDKSTFFQAYLNHLPCADETYTVITTFHVLEHIYPGDVDGVLSEMYRILKSEGHVLISIPYKTNYADPCHVCFYDEDNLTSLFEKHGFTKIYCIEDTRWSEKGLLTGLFKKVA